MQEINESINREEDAVEALSEAEAAPAVQAAEAVVEDGELTAELERLRGEVARLTSLQERARAELDEFCALFPTVSPAALPDEVRRQVDEGVPLPAAYALYERREAYRAAAGKKSAERSWRGMNEASGGDYFTPAEVKGMSQKEVHKHYKKIIESMKHWN